MVVGARKEVAEWQSGEEWGGELRGVGSGNRRTDKEHQPHAECGGTRERRPRGRRVLYHRRSWVRWGAMLWGLVVGLRGGRFGRLRR
jgi:hypothetical protein